MYAAREQKVFADGLEYTKRTEIIATNEGFVALEARTLEAQQLQRPAPPRLPPPVAVAPQPITYHPVVIASPPEEKCCCGYNCCECDDDYSWYSLRGKGVCIIILLLLLYLIGFAVVPAVFAAIAAVYIAMVVIACLCNADDN